MAKIDVIHEVTRNDGVTICGLLIKDSEVNIDYLKNFTKCTDEDYINKFLDILRALYNLNFGKIDIKRTRRTIWVKVITGGWSENEEIVDALGQSMFWMCFWERSERGGLHLFKINKKDLKG